MKDWVGKFRQMGWQVFTCGSPDKLGREAPEGAFPKDGLQQGIPLVVSVEGSATFANGVGRFSKPLGNLWLWGLQAFQAIGQPLPMVLAGFPCHWATFAYGVGRFSKPVPMDGWQGGSPERSLRKVCRGIPVGMSPNFGEFPEEGSREVGEFPEGGLIGNLGQGGFWETGPPERFGATSPRWSPRGFWQGVSEGAKSQGWFPRTFWREVS